ncbi:MAG: Rieske 2Fe-2S domain-containing protein, partial [Proteobacteria bacterium]|nr:Rieske 2Fe-2S domain-containing protein [Pseudomonadota bacterium]
LEGKGLPHRVLVLMGQDGNYYALNNKCTHGGRRLDPQPGQDQLQCCSVGKSVFHYAGHPLSGPAKGRLEVYPLDKQGANLVIRL